MVKRYNLVLPDKLYDALHVEATKHDTTVVELIRRFIKVGLLILRANETGGRFFIREDGQEREVVLI